MPPLPVLRAERLIAAVRRGGSSLPLIVETSDGPYVVKLRGAAQGTAALVAEVVVAELAEGLDLPVPPRAVVRLDADFITADRDAELADLLRFSHGLNLGFRFLDRALPLSVAQLAGLDEEFAARLLWLDGLVINVDRTADNPNLLWWQRRAWLIDHGAALPFQHDWAAVSEATPRRALPSSWVHLFQRHAHSAAAHDAALARRLSRAVLRQALARVPDDFLLPLLERSASADALRRRREAYVAFLWKRLKPPRPFV
ncbi:MAG: HipA family kinase [bacterium]